MMYRPFDREWQRKQRESSEKRRVVREKKQNDRIEGESPREIKNIQK